MGAVLVEEAGGKGLEGCHQRSAGPVKMPCCRQVQNHISDHFRVSAFCLRADSPQCNTLQNKRGLNTLPCRAPAWTGKGLLLLCSPSTSPTWCGHYHGSGHKKRMYRSGRLRSCLKTNVATSSDVCMKHVRRSRLHGILDTNVITGVDMFLSQRVRAPSFKPTSAQTRSELVR